MKEMIELPYTRQKRILERLNKNDCMTINELAKDFNVSQMTIYRDILQLEKSGDALRVYGGVKAVDKKEQGGEEEALKTSSILRPYCDVTIEERFNKQIDEKRAIARVAASYVKDGDVIAIDPSTTTLHMCSYLQNRKIIVVTTSISVALQFASSKSVDVILCGGMLRKRSLAIVGTFLPDVLEHLSINKCFISSHGFTYEQGLTDVTMEESDAKQQLISRSSECFVLIDHTKIGKCGPFVVCNMGDIDSIITDAGAQRSKETKMIMDQCADTGCKVIYAKKRGAAEARESREPAAEE